MTAIDSNLGCRFDLQMARNSEKVLESGNEFKKERSGKCRGRAQVQHPSLPWARGAARHCGASGYETVVREGGERFCLEEQEQEACSTWFGGC